MGARARLLVLVLTVFAATISPSVAGAHGIHADSATTTYDYLRLGVVHMLQGWDHLLFICGVLLLADNVGRGAKLISLFVLGHSTTLLLATLAGWQIDPEVVDVVIAVSVAYVGLLLLRGRPASWTVIGVTVFAFGLAHGLGLSTRLQVIDLPEGGALVARIVAFNIGIEIGQLIAIGILALLWGMGLSALRQLPSADRVGATALIAVGAISAAALSFAVARPDEAQADQADPDWTCRETAWSPRPTIGGGGHPSRAFYAPEDDDQAAEADLQHVRRDGLIIVRYQPSLPQWGQRALAAWVESAPYVVVVPGRADQRWVVQAETRESILTCRAFELDSLAAFREAWVR
jgi:hydrogenase/urease accessory protein HupE